MKLRFLAGLFCSLPILGWIHTGMAASEIHNGTTHSSSLHYSNANSRVEGLDKNTLNNLLAAQAMLAAGHHNAAAAHYLAAAQKTGSLILLNRAAAALGTSGDPRLSHDIAQEWLRDHPQGFTRTNPPSAEMGDALMIYYAQEQEWEKSLSVGLWLDENNHHPRLDALTNTAMDSGANPSPFMAQLTPFIQKHPNHLQPQLAKALVMLKLNQSQQALNLLQQLEKQWPKAPHLWLAMSQIQLGRHQPERALEALEHARSLSPENTQYGLTIAQLQLEMGRHEDAMETAQSILKSAGNNASQVRNHLGQIFLQAHQPVQAEDILTPNIKETPPDTEALLLMGAAAEEQKQWNAAVKRYSMIPANNPAFMPAITRASQIIMHYKGADAAQEYLFQELHNHPDKRSSLTALTVSFLDETGNTEKASDLLNKEISESAPNNDDLLMLRADRNIDAKHPDAVEQDMKVLLKRHPNDPDILNTYGYTLTLFTHRYAEAQKLLVEANQADPDNSAIMDSLGWNHAKMKQLSKARYWLEQAYKQDQQDEIAFHLASVLIMLNERNQAREIVNNGFEHLQHHPELSQLVRENPWLMPESHSSSPAKGAVSR